MSSDAGNRGVGAPLNASIPQHERGRAVQPVIVEERPNTPDARALITELETHLASLYPSQSRHGYSVDKLLSEEVAFFVVREAGVAAGCGGVQIYGTEYGELKRMYVRPAFRGRGLGKMMLDYLTDYGRERGVGVLRLETGVYQKEAIGLYGASGFQRIPPFAAYADDPLSLFFEKRISPEI